MAKQGKGARALTSGKLDRAALQGGPRGNRNEESDVLGKRQSKPLGPVTSGADLDGDLKGSDSHCYER